MGIISRRCFSLLSAILLSLLIASACAPKSDPSRGHQAPGNRTDQNPAADKLLMVDINRDMKNQHFELALEKIERLLVRKQQIPSYHLTKATILKKLDREQQALNYLTQKIEENPSNIGLIVARGQFLLNIGYIESARVDLLLAYKQNYRSFDILKILSAIERGNGNLAEALKLASEALKLNANDHALWYNKAKVELRLNRLQDAKRSCNTAMRLSDQTLKYHRLYIEILSYLKDGPGMGQHIRLLFQKFPDSAWVSIRYATLLYSSNERLKAKSILKDAIAKHPENHLLIFHLATIFAAEKNWEESIRLFLAGLKVKPDSTWAKVQLSKIYFQTGKPDKAVKVLEEARAEKSKNPFVYEMLARIYNRQNDTFEAEKIILEGLEVNRKNQTLILEYASLLEKRANYSEAIKAYEEALSNNSGDHVIYGKLGNLHRLTSNYKQSKTYFQRSIELKPDASWVRSYYVELLSDMEDWQGALAEIDQILQMTPDDYWAYAKKAQIQNQLKEFAKAYQSIQQAVKRRPDASWLKEIAGNSLESLKRYEEAEKSFQLALQHSSNNAYLLTRLAYVQLHLDKKAALATIEQALDHEDSDINTVELYLLLTDQAHIYWGFQKGSLEARAYDAIMHKRFDQAKKLMKAKGLKGSVHLPYLSTLSRLLRKESVTSQRSIVKDSPAKSGWHYFYLGMDAMENKKWKRAEQLFQKGLVIDSGNIWLMIKLAYAHQQLKDYQPAITLLKKYLENRSAGQNVWAHLRLALNYDLSFRYREAEGVYKVILASNPDDNVALNNLAWMYLTAKSKEMRKRDEALKLALKAVKISASPANLDTLAEAYYQKQEYQKALKTAERALDTDRMGLDDFKKTKKKILKAIQSSKK